MFKNYIIKKFKGLINPEPKQSLNLWWSKTPKPGNLGDILSPIILKKLGFKIKRAEIDSDYKFLAIGSITKFIKPHDIVWGSGIMHYDDPIDKDANYLAVRGPITGEKTNCEVYGDPGLLCSKLFPLTKIRKINLGIVPHYIDFKNEKLNQDDRYKINILNANPLNVIKKINKHKEIVSSSLHGIIIAHSYGIPAGWWRPSNRLAGDDSKFKDYAESVGIELIPNNDYKKTKIVLPSKEVIKNIQNNLVNVINNYSLKLKDFNTKRD